MFNANGRRHLLTRPGVWSLFLLLTTVIVGRDVAALIDPTRPPGRSSSSQAAKIVTAPTARLVLTSILVAPGRRVAVINGRPLQVGERIDDCRVVDIQFDQVQVKNDNRLITLTLNSGVIKRPVMPPEKGR